MPMKLLVGDEFTSDSDGNLANLAEIPDLQVCPKSFAVIFERFRPLQEQRKQQQQQQIFLQKKRPDSYATAGICPFLSVATAICAACSFFAALPMWICLHLAELHESLVLLRILHGIA